MSNSFFATLRTCLWNATFRRPLSLLLFFLILLFLWLLMSRIHEATNDNLEMHEVVDWEAEYEKIRAMGLKEHMSFYIGEQKGLEPVPKDWTMREKCPACFGTSMCDAIERGEVLVSIPKTDTPASKKGVYLGRWNDTPVAVKRLSNWHPKEFKNFDKYVCLKDSGTEQCDISSVIVKNSSFVQKDATFEPKQLLQAWKISYPEANAQSLVYVFV